MPRQTHLAVVTTISAALLLAGTIGSIRAQSVPGPQPQLSGTKGHIAKFVTSSAIGNSVLQENGGKIGLGTSLPASKLEIRGQDALTIRGYQPFLTFRDSNAGNARHVIQSVDGGLNLLSDGYLKGTNPLGYLRMDKTGKVGLGTATPLRTLQIGPTPMPRSPSNPRMPARARASSASAITRVGSYALDVRESIALGHSTPG